MKRHLLTIIILVLTTTQPVYARKLSPAAQAGLINAIFLALEDESGPQDCSSPKADLKADYDKDGIADCDEEKGVMGYITNPAKADTDGDALNDRVEQTILAKYGTNPQHKDILIEYDWFVGAYGQTTVNGEIVPCETSMQLQGTDAAEIIQMFAASPVKNIDGKTGINLVLDYGQGGALVGGNAIADEDGAPGGGLGSTQYLEQRKANFSAAREPYFHYILGTLVYSMSTGQLGKTQVGYSDTIISPRCNNTSKPGYTAKLFVHEFGHQLGLRHGGNNDCNNKPNYNSTMNYRYATSGLDTNCDGIADGLTMGYSDGKRRVLNETLLNEYSGMCGTPLDLNGDQVISNTIKADVNNQEPIYAQIKYCGGQYTELRDHNDWASLNYVIKHL